jgi:hypothetical protein
LCELVADRQRACGWRRSGRRSRRSYECCSRNRIKGAKLSEHGNANAIDVRTITLTNGMAAIVEPSAADQNIERPIALLDLGHAVYRSIETAPLPRRAQARYCSSLTFSIQSTFLPFSVS